MPSTNTSRSFDVASAGGILILSGLLTPITGGILGWVYLQAPAVAIGGAVGWALIVTGAALAGLADPDDDAETDDDLTEWDRLDQ